MTVGEAFCGWQVCMARMHSLLLTLWEQVCQGVYHASPVLLPCCRQELVWVCAGRGMPGSVQGRANGDGMWAELKGSAFAQSPRILCMLALWRPCHAGCAAFPSTAGHNERCAHLAFCRSAPWLVAPAAEVPRLGIRTVLLAPRDRTSAPEPTGVRNKHFAATLTCTMTHPSSEGTPRAGLGTHELA